MTRIHLLRRTILASIVSLAATPAFAQQRTAPEPGRIYRIGFAQIVDHPALNAQRQGFIDGLKSAGFEVGKNLVLDYQNAQGNPGAARNIIEKFIADKVDLLAPCTTPVTLATLRLAKDTRIPVAFGCVTNPVDTGILKSTTEATGTNVTGYFAIPPVKQNIDILLAIKPGVKTIGTIWNSGEANSKALDALAKAEADRRGIKWVVVTVTSSAEIKNAAESLVGKVDAFVTGQDNTVASAYGALTKVARDANIPWFSFDVLAVERGAVAALAQSEYQSGLDWAKKVAVPVLLGKDPGTIVPVESEAFEVHINTATAKAIGLTIPEAIVKQANKVLDK